MNGTSHKESNQKKDLMTKTYLPQVEVKKKILSEVMIKTYLQVRKHYTRGISI